jgi:hypothetical protein
VSRPPPTYTDLCHQYSHHHHYHHHRYTDRAWLESIITLGLVDDANSTRQTLLQDLIQANVGSTRIVVPYALLAPSVMTPTELLSLPLIAPRGLGYCRRTHTL